MHRLHLFRLQVLPVQIERLHEVLDLQRVAMRLLRENGMAGHGGAIEVVGQHPLPGGKILEPARLHPQHEVVHAVRSQSLQLTQLGHIAPIGRKHSIRSELPADQPI